MIEAPAPKQAAARLLRAHSAATLPAIAQRISMRPRFVRRDLIHWIDERGRRRRTPGVEGHIGETIHIPRDRARTCGTGSGTNRPANRVVGRISIIGQKGRCATRTRAGECP